MSQATICQVFNKMANNGEGDKSRPPKVRSSLGVVKSSYLAIIGHLKNNFKNIWLPATIKLAAASGERQPNLAAVGASHRVAQPGPPLAANDQVLLKKITLLTMVGAAAQAYILPKVAKFGRHKARSSHRKPIAR